MTLSARAVPAGILALALLTAACGDDGAAAAGGGDGQRTVLASFYPLEYVTARIAGDRATVQGLTPPGAEPHDLELSPKEVAEVSDADLLIYLGGFQPSVDEAVTTQAAERGLDVASSAKLDLTGAEEEGEEHAAEEAGEEHAEPGRDPHFWLDPQRLTAVAGAISTRLTADDPAGAATYRQNLERLTADLTALDGEFRTGLATCASRNLVTSHQAFGYLAQRYDLHQVGISGLTPEQEPDAATIASVATFVRTNKVRTIYYETLVSPAVAETVARETGAKTAVLDPIEGLTEESAGDDYLAVMRANLASLKAGQPCT